MHVFLLLFQVRRAVAQGVEIMMKGTVMIGQVMALTLLRTAKPHITPSPIRQSLREAGRETGPSGAETMARGASKPLPPLLICTVPPLFPCCPCSL